MAMAMALPTSSSSSISSKYYYNYFSAAAAHVLPRLQLNHKLWRCSSSSSINSTSTSSTSCRRTLRLVTCHQNVDDCNPTAAATQATLSLSCRKESPIKRDHLVKLAIATLAAGALTLGHVDDVMAAKSGGRVGGQAFRSAAPRQSSPRINNSRTNIYVNPPIAPPLGSGYGYGVPYYGGGWGWSPFSFFAPGPSVAVGVAGGFDFFALFIVLGIVGAIVRRFGGRNDDDEY